MPVTVKSPLKTTSCSVIVNVLLSVFFIVAPLPKVISLPVTVKSPPTIVFPLVVRSPINDVVSSVIVNVFWSVFTIVAPAPKIISLPLIVKSPPITALLVTDKPPSVCKEPSVVVVASVISFTCILLLNIDFLFNIICSLLLVVTNFIYDSFDSLIFKASAKLLFNLIVLFVSVQVLISIEKSFVATIWLVPTPILFFSSVL